MDKEEIKDLLLDFTVEYDPVSWSNEKVYDKFAEIFYKKVAELEAKLAEREKALEYARYPVARILDDLNQLKQQLAEKDQAIESLQEINQSLGQTCNNDAKEIERLREQLHTANQETLHFQNKYFAEKQIAIEELEKAKEFCNNPLIQNVYGNIPEFRVENFINNQIKLLKGEE